MHLKTAVILHTDSFEAYHEYTSSWSILICFIFKILRQKLLKNDFNANN